MTKKVLILSTSPRKGGNSDLLCDQFGKGAAEAGNLVEKVYVNDKTIGYCRGCYACQTLGECVQKDDAEAILHRMMEADAIVLATPVYFYSMSAQLKTLIDRTVPHYKEMTGKDFYFIATAADKKEMFESTIAGLYGFTNCVPGAAVKGIVYGEGAWKVGEIKATPAMETAYKMGKGV